MDTFERIAQDLRNFAVLVESNDRRPSAYEIATTLRIYSGRVNALGLAPILVGPDHVRIEDAAGEGAPVPAEPKKRGRPRKSVA